MTNVLCEILRLVRLTRILLPIVVSSIRCCTLLRLLRCILYLDLMDFLRITYSIMRALTINSERRSTLMRHALIFVRLLSSERYYDLSTINLTLRNDRDLLRNALDRLITSTILMFLLYREGLRNRSLRRLFLNANRIIIIRSIRCTIPSCINSVRASALARRNITALLMSGNALAIRRIVVLRRILASARIILFGLTLYALSTLTSR